MQNEIDNPTKTDLISFSWFLSKKHQAMGSATGPADSGPAEKRGEHALEIKAISVHIQLWQLISLLLHIQHNKGIEKRLSMCLALRASKQRP